MIDLNKIVDAYILISNDQDRLKNAQQFFIRNGIYYILMNGVEPQPDKIDPFSVRHFLPISSQYKEKSWAIREAHLRAIEYAKKEKLKRVAIFEDDVPIQFPLQKLIDGNSLIFLESDYDMVFLAGKISPVFQYIICAQAYIVTENIYDEILSLAKFSGMEIDIFYATVLQRMMFDPTVKKNGRFNILRVHPLIAFHD